jgi:hypothetical protein
VRCFQPCTQDAHLVFGLQTCNYYYYYYYYYYYLILLLLLLLLNTISNPALYNRYVSCCNPLLYIRYVRCCNPRTLHTPRVLDHCIHPACSIIAYTPRARSLHTPRVLDHCIHPACCHHTDQSLGRHTSSVWDERTSSSAECTALKCGQA